MSAAGSAALTSAETTAYAPSHDGHWNLGWRRGAVEKLTGADRDVRGAPGRRWRARSSETTTIRVVSEADSNELDANLCAANRGASGTGAVPGGTIKQTSRVARVAPLPRGKPLLDGRHWLRAIFSWAAWWFTGMPPSRDLLISIGITLVLTGHGLWRMFRRASHTPNPT
jgi:hypothetical protein